MGCFWLFLISKIILLVLLRTSSQLSKALGKCLKLLSQFSSVAQSCSTLCDSMNRSTPGLPVHHQLREFTQTRVCRLSDAIQPSHPWSSPSPPAPNPSQHQSLFQWVNQLFAWGGQSTGVSALAAFLPNKSQGWSPSEWTGWILFQFGSKTVKSWTLRFWFFIVFYQKSIMF